MQTFTHHSDNMQFAVENLTAIVSSLEGCAERLRGVPPEIKDDVQTLDTGLDKSGSVDAHLDRHGRALQHLVTRFGRVNSLITEFLFDQAPAPATSAKGSR